MVKIKDDAHFLEDGSIDVDAWLEHIVQKHKYFDSKLIHSACVLGQLAGHDQATESGESCLQQGLAMAEILVDLEVDQETIAAAIIFESVQYAELNIEDVRDELGDSVARLVSGVERMDAMSNIRLLGENQTSRRQIENIRKMLLAMVDDVRVVLIKLAERLRVLRTVASFNDGMKRAIAKEVFDIYAPLANRLGIGSIKWEMEDLAFRYLHPEKYKEIAKGLNSRRVDRDRYVKMVVEQLNREIKAVGIERFEVYGRSKHIHSIFRKMSRKNVPLSEIYDATAVRVLVQHPEECYTVLGIVHNLWQQILAEYDDYISNPKANGYKSLHTAVIGPEEKHFEVQIRTYQMHEEAELGVAAHWKYKEGVPHQKESYERKIDWLREVMSWHKEVSQTEGVPDDVETEFLDDRVYVFTPEGDIMDLPLGATPLDFAYTVHSEVGHRCRGAKVNAKIVPLTYALKTGEQVTILTAKEAKPSRDWLNPHLGYIKSSRAKAKIHHWFKQQDFEKNCQEGLDVLDREIKKLGIKSPNFDKVAKELNFKKSDDMHAALGRGDIRIGQIISKLSPPPVKEKLLAPSKVEHKPKPPAAKGDIHIEGVGNLLTHIARCCQPVPGDAIIGYITLGRGISIHKQDCPNILHATEKQQKRFIEVAWGEKVRENYPVDLYVVSYDRHGLLRDITTLLTNEKVNVFSLTTHTDKNENKAFLQLSVEVEGLLGLSRLLDKIKQLPNVIEARRQND